MKQLTEIEAEDFLEKEGFCVVKRKVAKNKEDMMKIAKEIKFPWVMKVSSEKIVHKAKVGGVYVGIQNIVQADAKFDEIKNIQGEPGAMIQETLEGEEIIIGIKKTSEFGPVVMFGKGGRHVEAEKDVSFRVVPLNKKDINEMVSETKVFTELKNKKINMNKIYEAIDKISKLAVKHPKIRELDINPLFVNKKQAIVADARISFEEK